MVRFIKAIVTKVVNDTLKKQKGKSWCSLAELMVRFIKAIVTEVVNNIKKKNV